LAQQTVLVYAGVGKKVLQNLAVRRREHVIAVLEIESLTNDIHHRLDRRQLDRLI